MSSFCEYACENSCCSCDQKSYGRLSSLLGNQSRCPCKSRPKIFKETGYRFIEFNNAGVQECTRDEECLCDFCPPPCPQVYLKTCLKQQKSCSKLVSVCSSVSIAPCPSQKRCCKRSCILKSASCSAIRIQQRLNVDPPPSKKKTQKDVNINFQLNMQRKKKGKCACKPPPVIVEPVIKCQCKRKRKKEVPKTTCGSCPCARTCEPGKPVVICNNQPNMPSDKKSGILTKIKNFVDKNKTKINTSLGHFLDDDGDSNICACSAMNSRRTCNNVTMPNTICLCSKDQNMAVLQKPVRKFEKGTMELPPCTCSVQTRKVTSITSDEYYNNSCCCSSPGPRKAKGLCACNNDKLVAELMAKNQRKSKDLNACACPEKSPRYKFVLCSKPNRLCMCDTSHMNEENVCECSESPRDKSQRKKSKNSKNRNKSDRQRKLGKNGDHTEDMSRTKNKNNIDSSNIESEKSSTSKKSRYYDNDISKDPGSKYRFVPCPYRKQNSSDQLELSSSDNYETAKSGKPMGTDEDKNGGNGGGTSKDDDEPGKQLPKRSSKESKEAMMKKRSSENEKEGEDGYWKYNEKLNKDVSELRDMFAPNIVYRLLSLASLWTTCGPVEERSPKKNGHR